MFKSISHRFAAAVLLSVGVLSAAHAQWAVVDAPATIQLIKEVQTLEQELQTAKDQLTQAKQALSTMTGDRGMELLLSGTLRNYLPSSMTQLTSAMQGGGGFAGLASSVRSIIAANAVLSPQQLAALGGDGQQQIIAGRQASALQQALSQAALSNASSRFASLQSLIDSISGAADQKAILDLQARISAELGMLQNEQTKLLVLSQATRAQDAVNRQRQLEQVIAAQGNFESRFQPVP